MNRKRPHFVPFGPPVPVVPLRDFSELHMTDEMMAGLWSVVGPSVELNMRRLPLWQVILAAYAEGLAHGSDVERHRAELAEPPPYT